MLWQEGTPQWVPAVSVPGLLPASTAPAAPPPPVAATPPDVSGTKIAAGVLGIIFGSLGVHKFILGMPGVGLTMLLVSILTCGIAAPVMHIIGIIEGIIYLTRSDQEFYRLYIVDKKPWF
ncbi:MAG: TM2 domain-containing protein [Planctomycetia bacterium]|nr:TM2 domain-containing protein [Planctomycetia bacterium]